MKSCFAICLACVSELVVSAAEQQVQSRVCLTTTPSGAMLFVDGKDRGVTPTHLYDLTPGIHHVKFRLAGYQETDCMINASEGPFVEKNVVLEEEKGLLLMKSNPEGADIVIDGVSVGTTPRLITHLASKDAYTVRLRKAGYQDQTLSVKFEGRKPLVREETLVLSSGEIDILSDPAGAEVMVNGVVRGKTPLKVLNVPRGRAVVKFHLAGFDDVVRELSVNAGDSQTLPVVLKALPGTMHLVSIPEGARFYVNEKAEGKGPISLSGLNPGEYVVRAELEGFGSLTRTFKLENGGSIKEEFRLSNVMGTIEVRSIPAGATVSLDGRVVGVTKSSDPNATTSDPFVIPNVLEGEHRLVLTKDGYAESSGRTTVKNQKTSQCRVRLRRVFTPDVEIVTSRGTYRGVLVSNTPEAIVLEVSLGINRSFPRTEIRKINFLLEQK